MYEPRTGTGHIMANHDETSIGKRQHKENTDPVAAPSRQDGQASRDGQAGRAREEAAAGQAREEERRAHSQPFHYPGPERRAGVRATRTVSREQADADSVPGVPGGYGTTGGGQPGGSSGIAPDSEGTIDPFAYADTIAGDGPSSGSPDDAPGAGSAKGSARDTGESARDTRKGSSDSRGD